MSSNDLTAMAFLGPILFGIAIATAIRVLPRGAAPEANDVLREALDLLSPGSRSRSASWEVRFPSQAACWPWCWTLLRPSWW